MDWDNLLKWSTQFAPIGDKIVTLIEKYKWKIVIGVVLLGIVMLGMTGGMK